MATYQSKHTGAEIDAGIDAAKNALPKNGGTMTGTLILAGNPTVDNGAATKKYVDDAIDTIELTPGASGADGAIFTPSVSSDGVLTWTNDKGLDNPDPVNIKGETGETGAQGDKGDKGDTGEKGETGAKGDPGEDGFSPIATVVKNGTNATITITDKNGTTSAVISDGSGGSGDSSGSGADGYSPIANVTKEGKTATITITDKSGTTSVQISDGADGAQGEVGQDGVSPTVAVQQISGGNRVTITDANGAQSFDVMDGTDGADNYTETDPTVPDWAKADTKPTYTASEISGIVDLIYPIGSIYMSVNTASPETLFGGTWERIKDTFLLAAGSTYEAGSTGGEINHTLTEEEIPNIHDQLQFRRSQTGSCNIVSCYPELTGNGNAFAYEEKSGDTWGYGLDAVAKANLQTDIITLDFGGGQPHNNMPPYLTVYMWKRTA